MMNRWVPMLAAGVATAGDLMMLRFVSERAAGGIPSLAWVVVGGVLGVLAIPLFGFGYELVVPTMRRWSRGGARSVSTLGALVGVLGAALHGLTAWYVVSDARAGLPALDAIASVPTWGAPMLALWAVVGAIGLCVSLLIVWGGFRLGAWALVFTSPVLVTLALVAIGIGSEAGHAYLLPAAPNMAHVVFFAVGAYASTRRLGRRSATLSVTLATTDAQILACYPVMAQLRPHVKPDEFVARVRTQAGQGYQLAFVREAGHVIAIVGFRPIETLAWGRVVYVDDLATDETWRSRGVGHRLLAWVIAHAREAGCGEVHLDSGVQRIDAHRFYEREGFRYVANHYRIRCDGTTE